MVQFDTFCARLGSLIIYRGNKRLDVVFDIAGGIDGLPFIHAVWMDRSRHFAEDGEHVFWPRIDLAERQCTHFHLNQPN